MNVQIMEQPCNRCGETIATFNDWFSSDCAQTSSGHVVEQPTSLPFKPMGCDFCPPDKEAIGVERCSRCKKYACRKHAPIVRDRDACWHPASCLQRG